MAAQPPDAILDPFKHASYADQIEDMTLKKIHYLKAIRLYKNENGCIDDWHLKYVDCLISLGQYRSAYTHIGANHKHVRGYSNKILRKAGNYHFTQKRYFTAVQLYEQINNNMIWRKRLNLKIGICYKHLSKYKQSLKHLKKYLRQHGEDKRNIITYIHLADVYSRKSKYKKALNIYNTNLTQTDIETHELFTNIGICYFKIHDFEKSLFYLNQQPISDDININQQHKINKNVCLFYKGYIYSRKCEMFEDALKCFKCINSNIFPPKHGSIDNELGYVYYKLNEFDLSLKYYTKITSNKNIYYALVNIAIIYSEKGNHRQAFKIYNKIHSMVNKSEILTESQKNDLLHNKLKLSYNVGICCYNSGEYKLSLKNLLIALKLVKKDRKCIEYWIKISFIYHKKLYKYHKANKYYAKLDKLKEINKQNMELLYADCLSKSGRYDDAFKITQIYLNKYPNSINGLNTLVTLNIFGQLKYNNHCNEMITKSLTIEPNSFYTNYIYAFDLFIIRKEYKLSKRYLNIAQSFINNRYDEIQSVDVGIVIDIAKLFTIIDTDYCSNDKGELKSFNTIGMYYFQHILNQFSDISQLYILYSHFLCRFKKLNELDMFHLKCMNEFRFDSNVMNNGLKEYAMDLHKVNRINFAIEIINKMEHKKRAHFKNLALLYEMKKDYNESLLYLKQCLNESIDFETSALCANLLLKMGRTNEAIDKFKIAFNEMNENISKKGKYLDMNFVISYIKAMCRFKHYTNCIEELLNILNNNDLNEHDNLFIHQLIVEIYGKINYYWDNHVILKHLKVIYAAKYKRVAKHIVCCNLI